jgi:hypothetical protein
MLDLRQAAQGQVCFYFGFFRLRQVNLFVRDKRQGVEAKMITVSIFIGETIKHKRALGAVPLAIKMLKTIKEP